MSSLEPTKADFPFVRSVIAVRSRVMRKGKEGESKTRYFISSLSSHERTPKQWLALIRGHWAGVENRNHWRRDACWWEDKTRSRNPNIVGALALLRNALLAVVQRSVESHSSLPAFTEACAARTSLPLNLIRGR